MRECKKKPLNVIVCVFVYVKNHVVNARRKRAPYISITSYKANPANSSKFDSIYLF